MRSRFIDVLRDPHQKLFQPCCARIGLRKSSCGFPVLRSVEPPLCTAHFDLRRRRLRTTINNKSNDNQPPTPEKKRKKKARGAVHPQVGQVVDTIREIQLKRQNLFNTGTRDTTTATTTAGAATSDTTTPASAAATAPTTSTSPATTITATTTTSTEQRNDLDEKKEIVEEVETMDVD